MLLGPYRRSKLLNSSCRLFRNPDYYHTCYCLSGLSLAEYDYDWDSRTQDFIPQKVDANPLLVS